MSKRVLDESIDYVNRFVNEYSRKFEFLSYDFLDAKFHPKLPDHLVVLGWNNFPKDYTVKQHEQSLGYYSVDNFFYLNPDISKEGLELAKKYAPKPKSEPNQDIDAASDNDMEEKSQEEHDNSQVTLFINETKEDMLKREKTGQLNDDSSSDDYEGGSDEENKNEPDDIQNQSENGKSSSRNAESDRKLTSSGNNRTSNEVTTNHIDTAVAKEEHDGIEFGNDAEAKISTSKVLPEIDQNEELKLNKENSVNEKLLLKQKSLQECSTDEKKLNNEDPITAFYDDQTQSQNSKINDETNHPPEEDKHVDEEEVVEPPAPIVPKTPLEEFYDLPKEQKQIFVNYVIEALLETNPPKQMRYHKQDPLLVHPSYQTPEDEKLNTNNFQNDTTVGLSSLYDISVFGDVKYEPPITKEKYQISIWKIDEFGMVKVKDRYFTPKTGVTDENIRDPYNFKMGISIDRENIYIEQTQNQEINSKYVIVFDPCSLKVLSETNVIFKDTKLTDDTSKAGYYENYYSSFYTPYPTKAGTLSIKCMNKGKYLLVPVTITNSVLIRYWNVYDTSTGGLLHSIKRVKELKLLITDMKQDPHDPDSIYFAGFNEVKQYFIYKLNVMTGVTTKVSENLSINNLLNDITLNNSCTMVICETFEYLHDRGYYECKVYQHKINQSPKLDSKDKSVHKLTFVNSTKYYEMRNDELLISVINGYQNKINLITINENQTKQETVDKMYQNEVEYPTDMTHGKDFYAFYYYDSKLLKVAYIKKDSVLTSRRFEREEYS